MAQLVENSGGDGELDALLRTLQDFDLTSGVTGAVLFANRDRQMELPSNLRIAVAAAKLGLTSLDHVRRTYLPEDELPPRRPVVEAFMRACWVARRHMLQTKRGLLSRPGAGAPGAPIGVIAASIALQRVDSGFLGAQLLYRIGLNFEADAVSRQVLEQIAWAVAAHEQPNLEGVERLQPQKTIGSLKSLYPEAGTLNGELSKVTHAGIGLHRTVLEVGPEGDEIVLAQEKLARAARIVLSLADAWALACEFTQRDYLSTFRSLRSREAPTPDPGREFLVESAELRAAVERAEGS